VPREMRKSKLRRPVAILIRRGTTVKTRENNAHYINWLLLQARPHNKVEERRRHVYLTATTFNPFICFYNDARSKKTSASLANGSAHIIYLCAPHRWKLSASPRIACWSLKGALGERRLAVVDAEVDPFSLCFSSRCERAPQSLPTKCAATTWSRAATIYVDNAFTYMAGVGRGGKHPTRYGHLKCAHSASSRSRTIKKPPP
jgi:hypothetical protein